MRYTSSVVLLFMALPASAYAQSAVTPEHAEFFEKRIRPVLAENCFSCHGPKKQQAGLRVDSRAALLKGSEEGPVVVAGKPEKSPLIKAIRREGDVKMPPNNKLPAAAIDDLAAWIAMGLPWPDDGKTSLASEARPDWKTHWAFQPVRHPAPPPVKERTWPATPVDEFILAALEAKGLSPNAPADRRTLLRRVTFDLIGLPPTIEEIAAFEKDASPEAFAKVVDRLLASPRYGERWGRHWLDVARYADTKGYVFQEERRYPYAYTYRDYVIRAFNEDLPYDRFIVEQLAADQLIDFKKQSTVQANQPLAAMGFLTLGRRFLNNVHDIIDDRIDVVGRGLLGLTVGCARCHDHKYDPIPTADYYSLHGVFAGSIEPKDLPLIGEPERTAAYVAFEKRLGELQVAVKKYAEDNKAELAKKNRKFRDGLRALQAKVDAFQASSPAAPPRAMILEDAPAPAAAHILLRGNANNPGPAVPRQFLGVLAGDKRQPFTHGSGRLDLARAIADKDNPLTARVLVNRLWLHHFGAGLVTTPGDFGLRSDPPSHPELLDYLAWRFMREGWSIKKIHRLILLSRVYQQSSGDQEAGRRADPENRLLWKYPRRRLDFEALRDSLLFVAGRLELRMGGAAVDITTAPFSGRRTVYAFIERQNLPGLFRTFDFASPDTTTPQRYQTTVPQQALFLLNSPFVLEQARHLTERCSHGNTTSSREGIQKLYRQVYGRPPSDPEIELGVRFLAVATSPDGNRADSWERYAQVLLLSNEFAVVD